MLTQALHIIRSRYTATASNTPQQQLWGSEACETLFQILDANQGVPVVILSPESTVEGLWMSLAILPTSYHREAS